MLLLWPFSHHTLIGFKILETPVSQLCHSLGQRSLRYIWRSTPSTSQQTFTMALHSSINAIAVCPGRLNFSTILSGSASFTSQNRDLNSAIHTWSRLPSIPSSKTNIPNSHNGKGLRNSFWKGKRPPLHPSASSHIAFTACRSSTSIALLPTHASSPRCPFVKNDHWLTWNLVWTHQGSRIEETWLCLWRWPELQQRVTAD